MEKVKEITRNGDGKKGKKDGEEEWRKGNKE